MSLEKYESENYMLYMFSCDLRGGFFRKILRKKLEAGEKRSETRDENFAQHETEDGFSFHVFTRQ